MDKKTYNWTLPTIDEETGEPISYRWFKRHKCIKKFSKKEWDSTTAQKRMDQVEKNFRLLVRKNDF